MLAPLAAISRSIRIGVFGVELLQRRVEHLADGEGLDDLRVLDLHVEALLIPVDQVLERRGQLLVGGDDGDELTDVEPAGDRQVAAHQIEDEGRHLGEQVVDEFDQELPLIDVEADEEDARQPAGDLGALPVRRVVDAHAGDALDDLADAAGELAGGQLPRPPEHQQPAPQPRDQHDLDADDRAGDQAERDALHQDEHHGGDRLADEVGGLHEGVADEAAERLHLVLHHGGDFGGAQPPELRQRKAQQRVDRADSACGAASARQAGP